MADQKKKDGWDLPPEELLRMAVAPDAPEGYGPPMTPQVIYVGKKPTPDRFDVRIGDAREVSRVEPEVTTDIPTTGASLVGVKLGKPQVTRVSVGESKPMTFRDAIRAHLNRGK